MKIGETIKDIRKRKGLSQQELATISGISQTYLSQLEKGDRQSPTIDVLHKISEALELPYPVLEFLSLDYSDIDKGKLVAFRKIETAVNELIKEFFPLEDKRLKNKLLANK